MLVAFAWSAATVLGATTATPEQWAKLVIVYTGGAFMIFALTNAFSAFIEQSIDSYPELSYLKLNRGDERLIEAFAVRRKTVYWRFIIGVVGNIGLGIVASKLERLL